MIKFKQFWCTQISTGESDLHKLQEMATQESNKWLICNIVRTISTQFISNKSHKPIYTYAVVEITYKES